MADPAASSVPAVIEDAVAAALGRRHRDDPVLPRTGGPAGNAQLTAWLGLALLVLSLAELVTLLDVSGLISWHIVLGVLLIPPALAKTATTGWRILRYYRHAPAYVSAGPPPLVLRLLGPLVVAGTLAVLGSGVLLIAVGPTTTFRPWFSVLGNGISPLTLHQIAVIVWAVATGLHVLARLVPAVQLASVRSHDNAVPGVSRRGLVLLGTAVAAVATALVIYGLSGSWTSGNFRPHGDERRSHASVTPGLSLEQTHPRGS
jgi:hypothetical protein